ncbi:MAG: bifunctional diguanylate cyclase/phosphodiesterase [Solirubrobacterales bacterium]|nr:bifunctional diguanylate cyclase/phosphodiesterase [Solirubrobacterales bacterium]
MDANAARMRVLVVGEEPGSVTTLPERFTVTRADALNAPTHVDVDCVLLAAPKAPLNAIAELRAAAPATAVVLLEDDETLAGAALEAGAQEVLTHDCLEAGALGGALSRAVVRRRMEVRLVRQALHDPLTSLPNRALFLDRCAQGLARKRRRGTKLALLFCDVDRFKAINDSYGHEAGDEVLVTLAERLLGALRAGDTAARLGGDEFVVLCEEVRGPEHARALAARLTAALSAQMWVDGHELEVSVSIGVTVVNGRDVGPEDLLRDADAAMYAAKRRGGGRTELFDAVLRKRSAHRRDAADELRRALERRELRLLHQPIHALADHALVGVEALVRWQHPDRGLLDPAAFLPAAEASGLIVPVGAWALTAACEQAVRWHETQSAQPAPTVSVNLSPRQLTHPDLVATVHGALTSARAAPAWVRIEFGEPAVLAELEAALPVLERLRAMGLSLVLDGFGTGPSSLATLLRCPVDVVKLDRVLVDVVADDARTASLVGAVLDLAHSLGLRTEAEGVERPEQAEALRDLGCDAAQGFLFARPQRAEGLAGLLGAQ